MRTGIFRKKCLITFVAILVISVFSSVLFSCKGALTDYKNKRPAYLENYNYPYGWAVLYDTPESPTSERYIDIRVGGKGVKFYKYRIDDYGWSKTYSVNTRIKEGKKEGESGFEGRYIKNELSEGWHCLRVAGVDAKGVMQELNIPTVFTWEVDVTPPVAGRIFLSNCPDGITALTFIDIEVSGTEIDSYRWKLESSAYPAETWTVELPLSAEPVKLSEHIKRSGLVGDPRTEYRLTVTGIDIAGNEMDIADGVVVQWIVDTINPIAHLYDKPDKFTKQTSIDIRVGAATDTFDITHYMWKTDTRSDPSSEWQELSPWSGWTESSDRIVQTGLTPNRQYRIQARGRDQGEDKYQPAETPTSYTWTVLDSTSMNLAVSNLPDKITVDRFADIVVGGGYVLKYRFSFDGSTWSTPISVAKPIRLTGLNKGEHNIRIVGIDFAGNEMSEADAFIYTWEIVDSMPSVAVLDNLPDELTNSTSTDITVGGEQVSGYMYRLDERHWSEQKSVDENICVADLTEGEHGINVIAVSSAGVWQSISSPTAHSWTIDITPPVAVFDEDTLPDQDSSLDYIAVGVGGEDVVFYRYSLDGGPWSFVDVPVDELIDETGLSTDSHTLEVVGRDLAGNWQSDATGDVTSFSWSVSRDETPPVVSAGEDITAGCTVKLETASVYDSNGIAAYSWSVISAPDGGSIIFSNLSGTGEVVVTDVEASANGCYILRLTASDPSDNTAYDEMQLTWNFSTPVLQQAYTLDSDHNGRLDHYRLVFNNPLDDSTFPGFIQGAAGETQNVWRVSGRTGVSLVHGAAAPESDTTDDNIIYLRFIETEEYDTGEKPDITTSGAPILEDLAENPVANITSGSVDETDDASPIIYNASGLSGSQSVAVNFSEPVSPSTSSCAGDIETSDLVYHNYSGNGAGSVTGFTDANACNDSRIILTLDTALTPDDINSDAVSAQSGSIFDDAGNPVSGEQKKISAAVSPYVLSVEAAGARKIRITYSEPMDVPRASRLGNYRLSIASDAANTPLSIIGTGGGNITVVSNSVYEFESGFDQDPATVYKLEVTSAQSDVVDQNEGVGLIDPKFGTFLGNEVLKISAATCINTTSMMVVFNKDVSNVNGQGNAERTNCYRFSGSKDLGSITSSVRGTGTNKNHVVLTHEKDQSGATFNVIGANHTDGDGFDDADWEAIKADPDLGINESLQSSPNDRTIWIGCGEEITSFEQGPIATDPFGDSSDFGYLANYRDKVYIGPNFTGNSANRFNPDGSNPINVGFAFAKDSDHRNDASSYSSIGFSGCTPDVNTVNRACGPDNEDGRGLFAVGNLGGESYLFLGGSRKPTDGASDPEFDYLYYTSDSDNTLDFKYIDLGEVTGEKTQGLSAMTILDNRVYIGMAKTQAGEGYGNLPDFGRVNFSSGSIEGDCSPGHNCDVTGSAGGITNGVRLRIDRMPYFGGATSYHFLYDPKENAGVNWAYIVGVDSLFVFNEKIYGANGGYPAVDHNGSIIRSNNSNPRKCDKPDSCDDWTEIAPRNHPQWHNSNSRFSLELVKTYDLIPADKAFASFAEFNGKLYVTRTCCSCSAQNEEFSNGDSNIIPGCTDSTMLLSERYTNRETQIWRCDPERTGSADSCESGNYDSASGYAGDWTLVDGVSGSGDGLTNFGDTGNHSITLLITNGSHLYVGFDNANGVEIYRTKKGITEPSIEDDFERVGGAIADGLGDPDHMKEIYSAISISRGLDHYLYVSIGLGGSPVAVYRNRNY